MNRELSYRLPLRTSSWLLVLLVVFPNDLQMASRCVQAQSMYAHPQPRAWYEDMTPTDTSSKLTKPRSWSESESGSYFGAVPNGRQLRGGSHNVRRFMWTQIEDMVDAGARAMKNMIAPDEQTVKTSYRFWPAGSTVRYIIRKPVDYMLMPEIPASFSSPFPAKRPAWYEPVPVNYHLMQTNPNFRAYENIALQDWQNQQPITDIMGKEQASASQVLFANSLSANDSTSYGFWNPAPHYSPQILSELHTRVGPILPIDYATIPYAVTENIAEETVQYLRQHSNSSGTDSQRINEQIVAEIPPEQSVITKNLSNVANNNERSLNALLPTYLPSNQANQNFFLKQSLHPSKVIRTPMIPVNAIRYPLSRGALKYGDMINKITIAYAPEEY